MSYRLFSRVIRSVSSRSGMGSRGGTYSVLWARTRNCARVPQRLADQELLDSNTYSQLLNVLRRERPHHGNPTAAETLGWVRIKWD